LEFYWLTAEGKVSASNSYIRKLNKLTPLPSADNLFNEQIKPECADKKNIRRVFGITRRPIYNLRKKEVLRNVSLRREGQKYGKIFYHIGRIREFLSEQESKEKLMK
jgi:hypothetical protein